MDVQFSFTARSDVGLLRQNNQDSGYAGQRLLVLADGMGGPAGGDIASSIVVAELAPLNDDAIPVEQMMSSLRSALQDAHDELIARSEVDPKLRGLGTTCIALLRSRNKLAMVHIGDSRAYLLRGGELIQVTTDHSFVQFLVDSGQITSEEAENHPKRSVILRVLGDSPGAVDADETMREAVLGDRWLLCSDGLSGVVAQDTIEEVLRTTPDLDECADKLIELALIGGAPDNVTCVLADVVPLTDNVPTTPMVVGAAAKEGQVPSRPIPGAAGRAAALMGPTSGELESLEDEGTPQPRRARWIVGGIGLALLGAVVLAGWFGWDWSRQQYFVLADQGHVVVYQGIPQKLGPLELGRPIEITDISVADLPPIDQQRLKEPVTRSSRDEIDQYLAGLKERRNSQESENSQSGGAAQKARENPQSGGDT